MSQSQRRLRKSRHLKTATAGWNQSPWRPWNDLGGKPKGPLRSVHPRGHSRNGPLSLYLSIVARYGQVALTVTFVLAVAVVQDPTVTVTLYVPGVLFVVTLVRTGFWRDDV
jgi:hypothetical protein